MTASHGSAAEQGQGIDLLGSEMLTWSDIDGEVGAFGGLLAPHLLSASGARALVAGPTSAAVILDVARRFTITEVLVRSFLDAQQLREALPAEVVVHCGPLDRMARGTARFDVVFAVAGIDRLHTAEEATPAPETVLGDLATLVADGGELFVGVGNPVGVDRLLSLSASSSHHDADWPDGFASGPAAGQAPALDVAQTVAALATRGFTQIETWHCHGRRSDPLVAAPAAVFTGRAADSVLAREVGHAYDVVDPSAPSIKDPAATVRDLVRAGLGASTAPLTIVHLGLHPHLGGTAAEPAELLLVQEPVHDLAPPVAYRLVPGSAGWTRELLGEPAAHTLAGLTRDTARLTGPVPSGPTLAEAIESCVAAHDPTAAGVLVRRYRDWLGQDGEIPGDRVPITPRLLAVDGEDLVPLDLSWSTTAPAHRDVVLARGLLDTAADLLARGVRHPWSPAASARVVATSLIAAAGVEDPAVFDDAVALDAALSAVPVDYDVPGNAGRLSYAELAELAATSATRAAEADEHVLWLLRRLQGRQRALRATRGRMEALEKSREMWIGRRIFVLRSLLRRWRTKRDLKQNGPAGEWKDPSTRKQDAEDDPDAPFTAEKQLLPPGYVPPADKVEVIPDED